MQTHGFKQHLVAVGRAVKRAGARAVVTLELSIQQLVTPNQSLRRQFAHTGFFLVRQARGHGPRRYKHRRQVAKMQGAY